MRELTLLTTTYLQVFRHPFWITAVWAIVFSLVIPVGLLQAAPGVDGNLTVTAADSILNRYSAVTAISGDVVTVSDIAELADGGQGHYANESLSVGDMILIYQAQGATFTNSSNTASYGAFAYNNAGQYEFGVVSGISGNEITLDSSNNAPYSCGGVTNSYDVATGNVQVVRVPQYINLTINIGASVIAAEWDGTTGGVVALLAQDTVVVDGQIDASGSGFRGGDLDFGSFNPDIFVTEYRQTDPRYGAVKGESILGFETEYTANNGAYSRGAPANGGGGGGSHNAGGGGGANGSNGGTWTGAGSPDTSDMSWDNAWDLDDFIDDAGTPLPAYFMGGAGGGRGGYAYADINADATLVGPSNAAWGGNSRLHVGGLGGRPVLNDPNTRLFLGGGAGAGDDNNLTGTPGGDGGGLIIIAATTLNGSGQIVADGIDANDALSQYQDGAGGGGAGGTVVLKLNSVSGTVALSAVGGVGGDVGVLGSPTDFPNESFGPGGGGGGGFVNLDSDAGTLTIDVSGGVNGITASEALSEFIPNGATAAYDGGSSTAAFSFPGCSSPTAISLSFAGVTAQINQWPVLLFLLLLGASGLWLISRSRRNL